MGKNPTAFVTLICDLKLRCIKNKKGKRIVKGRLHPGEENIPDDVCRSCDYLVKGGIIAMNPDLKRVISAPTN